MSLEQNAALEAIETSNLFSDMGLLLSKKMSDARKDGLVTPQDFLRFQANVVSPMMALSISMAFNASIAITEDIAKQFEIIKAGSDDLKKSLQRIEKAQKILTIGAQILATAALAVTFFAAPNPASALGVISSIGGLIESLGKDEDADEA